jgi:hypothetical protein
MLKKADQESCPSPKCHPIPKCLAWVSCKLVERHYEVDG